MSASWPSRAEPLRHCGGSCSADPLVADLRRRYGSCQPDYEGLGAAPAIGNTTAALRAGDGCTDTGRELERLLCRGAVPAELGRLGHALLGLATSAGRWAFAGRAGGHRRRLSPLHRAGAPEHQLRARGRR